jgi:hopene-associated glycosyltransferase HpnB
MPLLSLILEAIAASSLAIWLVLFFFWGDFWHVWEFSADYAQCPAPPQWPRVTAIVPARNEAASIAAAVQSLALQDYPGQFTVTIVDDHSGDGTAEIARRAATEAGAETRIRIIAAPPLETEWTGKLWAQNAGINSAVSDAPDFFWFTDADIVHSPHTLRRLISHGESNRLDLTSLMVLLKSEIFAERLLIPPFVYFFLMLYPPRWTANRNAKTAGAAGGCILLRRAALDRIGGISSIRCEVIDDCALARAVKKSGGAIWMGLTRTSRSVRAYPTVSEIRDMIARTAFTQLHHSLLLLLATVAGMALTFLVPVVLAFSSNIRAWPFALAAWCLMTASFLPTITFYRLRPFWAPLLPLAALFYTHSTFLSAVRYWLGRGGQWKGRAQAQRK